MASYQQSRRSNNKRCTVEVWLDHFTLKIWRYFYFLGAFVYSHTTSYIFAKTLTLDDPVHGQETSIESWSYLTRMANLNKKKGCMNENVVDQHFHFPRNARKNFRVLLKQQPTHKRLLPRNLLNQWIHLIPYWIKTHSIVLHSSILTSSPNLSEKTQKLIWDNVARSK